MAVGLDHPAVLDYLARLEAAAAPLPPARRAELVAEIRAHLAEALSGSGGTSSEVYAAIDRLGDPAEIVAAEGAAGPAPADPGPRPTGLPFDARPPGLARPAADGPWGPVEIGAVLLLTIGSFLLPGMGPLIGIVLAWISTRWTTREKVVATLLCAIPLLVTAAFAVLVMGRFFIPSS